MVTSGGPFAETKRQLGGYHLIEVYDHRQGIPGAGKPSSLPYGGSVEVRPVQIFEH